MKNLKHWMIDYFYMLRGGMLSLIHLNPPKHYLNFVSKEKSPILILPGIMGRWPSMKKIADILSMEGHPVHIIPNLKYNIESIHQTAQKVWKYIEEKKIKNAILIAHSKGGLIGKYVLCYLDNSKKIKGMIALATPFSGTSLAKIIPHPSYLELLPESEIINKLDKKTAANKKIISIMPAFDNHIWHEKRSRLEGALENIVLKEKGHNKILFSKEVMETIRKSIGKLEKN